MSDQRSWHTLILGAGAQIRRTAVGRSVLDARLALRQRWLDRRLAGHDRRRLTELLRGREVKLNVGSSTEYVEGWVNVDIVRDPGGEILKLDATTSWPFSPDILAAVNSEHFIEHLSPEGAAAYLGEAFRALRPGAPIRTSTPDLEGMCKAYLEASPEILEEHRSHGYQAESHGDIVNNYFYSHGHRHIYDFVTLERLLRAAGFVDIRRASFGESEHQLLAGIDRHDAGALRELVVAVDAVKPRR
jgi:predicted SAM-dependent methyltransferase